MTGQFSWTMDCGPWILAYGLWAPIYHRDDLKHLSQIKPPFNCHSAFCGLRRASNLSYN